MAVVDPPEPITELVASALSAPTMIFPDPRIAVAGQLLPAPLKVQLAAPLLSTVQPDPSVIVDVTNPFAPALPRNDRLLNSVLPVTPPLMVKREPDAPVFWNATICEPPLMLIGPESVLLPLVEVIPLRAYDRLIASGLARVTPPDKLSVVVLADPDCLRVTVPVPKAVEEAAVTCRPPVTNVPPL